MSELERAERGKVKGVDVLAEGGKWRADPEVLARVIALCV